MIRKRLNKRTPVFDAGTFLSVRGPGKRILTLEKSQVLFSQGDAADAVFYILAGRIKLTVISLKAREAVIAILMKGAFLGETCLTAQLVSMKTATSVGASSIVRIEKAAMIRLLDKNPAFSEHFMTYLLSRNVRIEKDLLHQLFNSTEKRLARVLLLLAHYGQKSKKTELLAPGLSHGKLADMLGITVSKVGFFMKRFRKLGFIDTVGGLRVHSSLLNVVLHD
jgi:CRP/FNR family transcriptional regulator, cyclic AMP receptor protein